MALEEEEQRMQMDEKEPNANDTGSSSEDGSSDDEEASETVEWLATGREKRSTAGNRLKSMIAAEGPDDDLELLFAEDENDDGFTEVEDEGSDMHMDSSSDEEDARENGDDLDGEKELEKQARESRQAARKRKAQEAIPVKFRKKVKIDTRRTSSSTPTAPQPRPKKKSERTSWLPSPAEMPTRASKRETTMLGKEQLHRQMIEREVRRLKQAEIMERKAKAMEALKKPPMTQAERLAEAALVEKKNAKSLNRWEEAEKQREEERKAKLAALHNRKLEGPVVTFWSGVGEWVDGKLKHVGKIITIEEKSVKKKRASTVGHDVEISKNDKGQETGPVANSTDKVTGTGAPVGENELKMEGKETAERSSNPIPPPSHEVIEGDKSVASAETSQLTFQPIQNQNSDQQPTHPPPNLPPNLPPTTPVTNQVEPIPPQPTPISLSSQAQGLGQPEGQPHTQQMPTAIATETRPQATRQPDVGPSNPVPYTTSMFAPPQQSPLMKPPEMQPPSSSFLAPPAGINQGGLSMPMIGYQSSPNPHNHSTVLAPPNTAQRQSPLSMPQPATGPPPTPTPARPAQTASAPTAAPAPQTQIPATKLPAKAPINASKAYRANAPKYSRKEIAPSPPPTPPPDGKATRNCIILQNFNENAIKEKNVQTRILFGREMNKMARKVAPAPRCVITNYPAKYRDPKTGLPYYNSYAFRELQKVQWGEYKWSRLGVWIGNGSQAAKGVPDRFLNPDAPGPPKKVEVAEGPTGGDTEDSLKADVVQSIAPETAGQSETAGAPVTSGSESATTGGVPGAQPTQVANSPAPAPVPAPVSATEPAIVPAPSKGLSSS